MFVDSISVKRKLRLIAEVAKAEFGIHGTIAVASSTNAPIQHTRSRAATGGRPRRIQRYAIAPPANPPAMLNTVGIQTNCWLAWFCGMCRSCTKYTVVQPVHNAKTVITRALAIAKPQRRLSRRRPRMGAAFFFSIGRAGTLL